MKIAAGWYEKGLGQALGFLVGALVVGTAFPHLVRTTGGELPWQWVMISVSVLAILGGVLMFALVPDGPHLPKSSAFNPRTLLIIFQSKAFRASALGYFGHMWELYALWAFVPLWLAAYSSATAMEINVPLWSFLVIGAGFLGCSLGGLLASRLGSARVASTIIDLGHLLPVVTASVHRQLYLVAAFLLLWGITVVGDSPQLSTLNAENAPRERMSVQP